MRRSNQAIYFRCVDRYFCWFVAINRIFWNCNEGGILWQYGYKRLYLGNHADIQSSLGLAWWLDGYV